MRNKRKTSGFTMAELLIVVAIIGILSGVTFIAVQNHQKSMARLERDETAKEIFYAAQNHLSMAESQGYMGVTKFTTSAKNDDSNSEEDDAPVATQGAGTGVLVITSDDFSEDGSSILDVMLPFGSIDDTVRKGGRYVILYRSNPAMIQDVFYWTTDSRYGKDDYKPTVDYLLGKSGNDNVVNRSNHTPVLGWYGRSAYSSGEGQGGEGGEGSSGSIDGGAWNDALNYSELLLELPSIEVVNAEKLIVKVTDPNLAKDTESNKLVQKLLITGSKAEAAITLSKSNVGRMGYEATSDSSVYSVVLDDITTPGLRFADTKTDQSGEIQVNGAFVPGEDITVKAVVYSNAVFANVAYSSERTVNSLFAEVKAADTANDGDSFDPSEETLPIVEPGAGGQSAPADLGTALIANIRHLENLDPRISGVTGITGAAQIVDLTAPETKTEQQATQEPTGQSTDPNGGFASNEDTGLQSEGGETGGDSGTGGTSTTTVAPKDLSWDGFRKAVNASAPKSVQVYYYEDESETQVQKATPAGCFLPVNPENKLKTYDGKGHAISDIVVGQLPPEKSSNEAGSEGQGGTEPEATPATPNIPDNRGLFGTAEALSIKDLKLTDFYIVGGTNAGALAGSLTGDSSVDNVVAYNAADFDDAETPTVTATGNAGGLIGNIEGTTSVTKSAAALIVKSTGGNAGGLIGASTSTGSITQCYSGGHTVDDATTGAVIYSKDNYNVVTAATNGVAGGLIGDAGAATITNCYSTCSVSGATAGGLAGNATGNIKGCYATGLVDDTKTMVGAFVGTIGGTNPTNSWYFEIINETIDSTTKAASYLPALGNKATDTSVKALDEDIASYKTFVDSANWEEATPYNATLPVYYGVADDGNTVFILPTVEHLPVTIASNDADVDNGAVASNDGAPGAGGDAPNEGSGEAPSQGGDGSTETTSQSTPDPFVYIHYGDWPVPEIFVVNTPAS